MRYVCDVLFAGNVARFSRAVNINQGHLYQCLYERSRVTAAMLAQVSAYTAVRADWLLTGTGPMTVGEMYCEPPEFVLPQRLNSLFPVLNVIDAPSTKAPPRQECRRRPIVAAAHAGSAVYSTRVASKPVCFFLGVDAVKEKCLPVVQQFLAADYLTGLATTMRSVPKIIGKRNFDSNSVAALAAAQGIGYGEAIGRQGDAGIFGTLVNLKKPITVHGEIGEVSAHIRPALHGAEVGAAIGAAAYADMLVLAAQLQQFSGPVGGTAILLGEADRWLRLMHAALSVVRTHISDEPMGVFSVIVLGPQDPAMFQEPVAQIGGQLFCIQKPYLDAATELLHACDAAYAGTATR